MHRMDDNMPFLLRYENVAWYDSGKVRILDRRVFPEVHFVECSTYREVRQAVADMVTQSTGPYAAVAMGMVLAAKQSENLGVGERDAQDDRIERPGDRRRNSVNHAASPFSYQSSTMST